MGRKWLQVPLLGAVLLLLLLLLGLLLIVTRNERPIPARFSVDSQIAVRRRDVVRLVLLSPNGR